MQVTVIGAGTMGHGIAQVTAMAGMAVRLIDRDQGALDRAVAKVGQNLDKGVARGKVAPEVRDLALAKLSTSTELDATGSDLVIEAVPEILELKQSLLTQVEAQVSSTAILATNTSSLPIASIGAALKHPERLIGAHFFNPVHIMALLEVIVSESTNEQTLQALRTYGEAIGKEVIVVKDVPGFATSRLGVCLGMEAIRMLEQGVASAEDIDKAMVLGYRHPIGPLRLTDLVGLDVRMHIGEHLAEALGNPAFKPPELMKSMVEAGKLGKKSGQGFYDWNS